jgi:hypothetical protein
MKYYHYLDLNWIEVSKKIKNFSFEVKNSSWGTTTTMGWFNFDILVLELLQDFIDYVKMVREGSIRSNHDVISIVNDIF